jgi:hypothetical protein
LRSLISLSRLADAEVRQQPVAIERRDYLPACVGLGELYL